MNEQNTKGTTKPNFDSQNKGQRQSRQNNRPAKNTNNQPKAIRQDTPKQDVNHKRQNNDILDRVSASMRPKTADVLAKKGRQTPPVTSPRQEQSKPLHNSRGQTNTNKSYKGNTQKAQPTAQSQQSAQIRVNNQGNTPPIQDARRRAVQKSAKGKLRIAFLGGVGEIGKNMTVFEQNDDLLMVDCGVSFPNSDTPGVDLVIPDVTYLKSNADKIRGIILTHGHEDHIGAVPFVVKEIASPHNPIHLYGSRLTLALTDNKLIEHRCTDYVVKHEVDDEQIVSMGSFECEFIRVTHSVAGSYAVCLSTNAGKVFMTGDFKIDHTPKHSKPMNLGRISQIGNEGVALLLCDSTNVERAGYTVSERYVGEHLNEIFEDNKERRIIIATFSSNVDRIQEVFALAAKYNRKVAISGRSMTNTIETASNAGYLKYDPRILVATGNIERCVPSSLVVLSTGSQGEPMSALTRMASGEFNKVIISKDDTIVISASPIPGNEKDVYNVINKLFRLGAHVIYSQIDDVHASGHAQKEELKLIHALLKPRFFVPVHGEYRHLVQHSALAIEMGCDAKNIVIAENGDCVELTSSTLKKVNKIPAGNVYIDGLGVGDVGSEILKDRLSLSEDGIVIVVCGVENGMVTAKPQVFSRGCLYAGNEKSDLTIEEIRSIANNVLGSADLIKLDLQTIKGAMTKQIRNYFRKKYNRYPVVIAIVMSSALD